MKSPYELIRNSSKYLYDKFSQNPSGMLIITSTVGWILSGFAQIGAVAINKDIPKDQKKFLIPQEICDAVINIGTFFLFTRFCDKGIKKLISTGKLLPKPVRDFANKNISKEKIGNISVDIKKELKTLNASEEVLKSYDSFKNGATVLVNLGASVIAGNLFTPVLRNTLGAKIQKDWIAKEKQNLAEMNEQKKTYTPAQNSLNIDNYKSKSYNLSSNSGFLKI